jgi:hypothetical protein
METREARVSVGNLVWLDLHGATSDTIGSAEETIQARPSHEPHVRVKCLSGRDAFWDVNSTASVGKPRPHGGSVIVKWVGSSRPTEPREHESWPIDMLAPNGHRAVRATDPWGKKHWLILPLGNICAVSWQ